MSERSWRHDQKETLPDSEIYTAASGRRQQGGGSSFRGGLA